jgi:hypothetical protein
MVDVVNRRLKSGVNHAKTIPQNGMIGQIAPNGQRGGFPERFSA